MAPTSSPNPYVGPYPFTATDALFGRDTETRQLLSRLIADRVVMMYSPSGAGKTSLIQASLLPRLREMGFLVRPLIRINLDLSPGKNNHNRYLLSAMTSVRGVTGPGHMAIDGIGSSFADYLEQISDRGADHKVEVLVFDQFEEILTLDPTDDDSKRQFFEQVGVALADPSRWALFAMREEYVAALDPYRLPVPGRFASTFRLGLLHREAAVEAMVGPAREAGVEFERDAALVLADQLRVMKVQHPDGRVTEKKGPAIEPVQLQVVCRRLWDQPRADSTRITVSDVDALGDDARALVDDSLGDFYSAQVGQVAVESPTPERLIRRWFGATLISQSGVRLTVLREPESTGGLDNATVDALIDARLLRQDWAGGRAWIELSHDRLVSPVLSQNEAWFAAHLHPVQRGAVAWEPTRSDSLLLRGPDYADAVAWLEESEPQLLPIEEEYLNASKELADQERRDRRIRQVIAGLLAIAIVAAIFAWRSAERARDQEVLATSRQLSAEATAESTRGDIGLLLALEAAEALEAADLDPTLEVKGAVMTTLEKNPAAAKYLHGHTAPVVSVEFSPDGSLVATGGEDRTIWLFNVESGAPLPGMPLRGHEAPVFGLAFNPDGSILATSDDSGSVLLWDVQSQARIADPWLAGDGRVRALAFHPSEGHLLAAGGADGSISIWDTRDLEPTEVVPIRGHEKDGQAREVRSIDFSPDGSLLVSGGDDGQVRLWDAVTGRPIGSPAGDHNAFVRAVDFNPLPDRRTIASAGNDETVILWSWDAESGLSRTLGLGGEELPEMMGHTERIYGLAFAPDGNLLASASRDGTVLLWDTRTGERYTYANEQMSSPLSAHRGAVRDLAFSQSAGISEPVLATASNDRTVILWETLRRQRLGARLETGTFTLIALAQHPELAQFASAVDETSVQTWDAGTLQRVGDPMPGHTGTIRTLTFDWAGDLLASGGDDCQIRVWTLETSDLMAILDGHTARVTSVAFAPDGENLISAGKDGNVLRWDLETTQAQLMVGPGSPDQSTRDCESGLTTAETSSDDELSVEDPFPAAVWFTPDGEWLVAGWNDGSFRVWPWRDGEVGDMSAIAPHDLIAMPRHLGTDGTAVAVEGDEILVWSLSANWTPLDEPGEPRLRIVSPDTTGIAMGPSGTIVSAGLDGGFHLWDLASGSPVGEPVPTGARVNGIVSFENPPALVTAGEAGTLIRWNLDFEHWLSLICPIANGNLEEDQWEYYFPSQPYRDSCPTPGP